MIDQRSAFEADEAADGLTRPQKRLLKRLYNGRTVPVTVAGQDFLTYRDAARYLLSRTGDAREEAYAAMKAQAKGDRR